MASLARLSLPPFALMHGANRCETALSTEATMSERTCVSAHLRRPVAGRASPQAEGNVAAATSRTAFVSVRSLQLCLVLLRSVSPRLSLHSTLSHPLCSLHASLPSPLLVDSDSARCPSPLSPRRTPSRSRAARRSSRSSSDIQSTGERRRQGRSAARGRAKADRSSMLTHSGCVLVLDSQHSLPARHLRS